MSAVARIARNVRWDARRLGERAAMKLIWSLPRKVVYWCAIRLMAHASCGKWGNETPDSISMMTALDRWDK